MEWRTNLGVIYDLRNDHPVGVICSNPNNGDIAYSTDDKTLDEVLEILLDNRLSLVIEEDVDGKKMIREESVAKTDSYYLMALNYALPFPWRILKVRKIDGDVEEIVNEAFHYIVMKVGDDHE